MPTKPPAPARAEGVHPRRGRPRAPRPHTHHRRNLTARRPPWPACTEGATTRKQAHYHLGRKGARATTPGTGDNRETEGQANTHGRGTSQAKGATPPNPPGPTAPLGKSILQGARDTTTPRHRPQGKTTPRTPARRARREAPPRPPTTPTRRATPPQTSATSNQLTEKPEPAQSPHDPHSGTTSLTLAAATQRRTRGYDLPTAWHSIQQHSATHHSKAHHSTAHHGTARHSTARRGTAQQSAAQHGTARHDGTQHGTARHGTAWQGTTQHSTAQQSTVRHSTAQQSKAQHSTTQHSKAHHTTAKQGKLTVGLTRSNPVSPLKGKKQAHWHRTPPHGSPPHTD